MLAVRGDGPVLDTYVSRFRDAEYLSLARAEREAWRTSQQTWERADAALKVHQDAAARWGSALRARDAFALGGAPPRT